MNDQNVISIRGLSKAFPLHKRKTSGGIDTGTTAGFLTLFRGVFRPQTPELSEGKVFWALKNINLDVKKGEVLGVIGRNGAGKSTLLKVLARVLQPTEGRIEMKGRLASLLELGLGMSEDLTLRENIHLQGRLAGLSYADIMNAEDNILEFCDLREYRDLYLDVCPSGSFIRLAFSTMINMKADIILADEVLAVGDAEFRRVCIERILSASELGETTLFVSHDMKAVKQLCSRCIWVDKGQMVMDGDVNEVVDAYVREMLSGHLQEGGGDLASGLQIVDLCMLDPDGGAVGALEINQGGAIRAIVSGSGAGGEARVYFQVYQGRRLVFSDVSPPLVTEVSDGQVAYACLNIPPCYLNEARYLVKAMVKVSRDDEGTQGCQELSFDAFNTQPEKSVWANWKWGKAGLISPALKWEHEKNVGQLVRDAE